MINNKVLDSEKHYYSIGEVADHFGVNSSLIRFWEKEFDIIQPKKNRKGNRFFTHKDLDNLHTIFHLVKERGFTLDGSKKKLKENKGDGVNTIEVVRHLKHLKEQLLKIKNAL
jgi:DNA-binding transcriptional MerR regulator